jgi:hypothetical protein
MVKTEIRIQKSRSQNFRSTTAKQRLSFYGSIRVFLPSVILRPDRRIQEKQLALAEWLGNNLNP